MQQRFAVALLIRLAQSPPKSSPLTEMLYGTVQATTEATAEATAKPNIELTMNVEDTPAVNGRSSYVQNPKAIQPVVESTFNQLQREGETPMTRRFRVVTAMVLGALLTVAALMGGGRLLAEALASDSVPESVNYQGYLTDSGGNPISSTVTLQFGIWDASSGGNQVWSETHNNVPVSGGYFSVFLGSQGSPLTPSVFSSTSRYLEVTYNATTFSRQRFASVPYALVAQKASTAITSTYATTATYASSAANASNASNASQANTAISATYATTATYALNAPSGGGSVAWDNVVVVAKSGGDYTSISAAMNAISPSSSDRYLVLVMPGVYEEQVTLDQYVHLKGAGTKTTIVRFAANNADVNNNGAAVMLVPANSQVSNLAVINTAATNSSVGVKVTSGNDDTLLDTVSVAVTGTAGVNHYAIYLSGGNSNLRLHNLYASASGATTRNWGILVNAVKPFIDDSTAMAVGGDFAYGLRFVGGEATITDSSLSGTNGSDGAGLSTSGGSGTLNIYVDRSSVEGDQSIENSNNFFVYLGASLLGGTVTAGGAPSDVVCAQSYDAAYVDLDANCQ